MKLFLDTSVLLAAAGSMKGASRFVVEQAETQGWSLLTAPYCIEEALRNARKIGPKAPAALSRKIIPKVELVPTELAFDKALVFPKAKIVPCYYRLWERNPIACSRSMKRISKR